MKDRKLIDGGNGMIEGNGNIKEKKNRRTKIGSLRTLVCFAPRSKMKNDG